MYGSIVQGNMTSPTVNLDMVSGRERYRVTTASGARQAEADQMMIILNDDDGGLQNNNGRGISN